MLLRGVADKLGTKNRGPRRAAPGAVEGRHSVPYVFRGVAALSIQLAVAVDAS